MYHLLTQTHPALAHLAESIAEMDATLRTQMLLSLFAILLGLIACRRFFLCLLASLLRGVRFVALLIVQERVPTPVSLAQIELEIKRRALADQLTAGKTDHCDGHHAAGSARVN